MSINKIEPKLLNVQRSAAFLGVNPATIRKWAKTNQLNGVKIGSRGDWRFTREALSKLTSNPSIKEEQKKFTKIKQLLKANEIAIQTSATSQHTHLIGGDSLPKEHVTKYRKIHTKMIRAIANNLDDFEKGTKIFQDLGIEVATDANKDGLTIEEAVDGTIFLKQAIWKKLEETGLLKGLSTQDLFEFSQIIGSYCDILSSKIAFTYHNLFMEEITSSEKRFRVLTEKNADAIALVDRKGKVLHASESTKKVMGYTPEEFKKLSNPFELVPPNERKLVTKLFEKLLKKPGSVERTKYQIMHKGGYAIWVESVMSNLLEDPDVKAIVINYSDITARKESDEKVRKSEERFRALVNATSEVVYRMSPDWKEMQELRGKNFLIDTEEPITNWLEKYTHPDDKLQVKEAIKKSIRTKSFFQLEYKIKQVDGTYGWIFSRAIPILDKKGKIIEWFGAASDITKQKELEQQKDSFLGIVSHELKTPVTSIKTYGQVLEKIFQSKGDVKAAEMLSKMDTQINRLNDLIADLLDVTKINSGQLQFHEDYFDFNELVNERVEEMQRLSEKHKIIVVLTSMKKVYGDRERLGQVLTNFITNAIKYSPNGKKIIVSTFSKGKVTTLSVQDFGLGIAKENIDQVFEQFFRVDGPTSETFPGLGLGLYISSEIVKREVGKIWVESVKGEGSTFSFSIPIKKAIHA
ncbi:PAS domain S-box protein [Patescibacteria group bacterium]|nr:PAS domain S-box protein [Patescibacteria group bacterium]